MTPARSRLALSIGCPCGVGAEVSVVAVAKARAAQILLVGDHATIADAARGRGIDARRFVRVASASEAWELRGSRIGVLQPTFDLAPQNRKPGAPTRASGAAQLAWIDAACDLAAHGEADAMVTGPVSKDAIASSNAPHAAEFRGHTEHLQRRLRAREVVMAFWSEHLVTALVTTHLALKDVPRAITSAAVARASFWLADLLARLDAGRASRIAVGGLNPHAGEAGLLGREEVSRIAPGMARARDRLAEAGLTATLFGPVPAESAMRRAVAGHFDGVVAMYHDQATIPMKLVGFGEAVNVTLALPIVRTSVDHGTAYDRAGTNTADARGMREAIALAARLSGDGTPRARATRAKPR